MRLEKIVLHGFKSFADKTEFVFNSPITAIVGPNGCGKSNVVDAVKWVLGEQSVKSLRSGQMADVIFGGSSSRKPMGWAEVSLFLSNPGQGGARQLPIEVDEVQITRKIYKSGESEYRINGRTCRLRDVRELFMDTGVGTKAYSILEQGQVEYLVSASKAERRSIFEEAAGISKYKAHKKEALRKLEKTEQNLLRLADILGEVARRLRSVKLQAGKARNYLEYTRRLKELQVNYSVVEYARNEEQLEQRRTSLERLGEDFGRLAAEVARQDSLISELGARIIEAEHRLGEAGNRLVFVQSKIEQRLQRVEFLRARIDESEKRKASAAERIEKLRGHKDVLEADSQRCRAELDKAEQSLEQKQQEIARLEEAISQVDAERASLEARIEEEKSGIIEIVRRTAQLRNELESISTHRRGLASQKERLAGRARTAQAEIEELLAEKARYKARLGEIDGLLEELADNLKSRSKRSAELEELIAEENRRLAETKEVRSALSGELAILRDMEKRREGLKVGVRRILESASAEQGKPDYVEGLVADIIKADMVYAAAVEAALEGLTDALVVNSTSSLLGDSKMIEKLEGRVSFVGLDRIEPFVDSVDLSGFEFVKGRLVEFVEFEGRYAPLAWNLLGRTAVVDSLDSAMAAADRLPRDYRFVTLDGELLEPGGVVRLGPLGAATGLISRKSRLRQLEESINDVTGQIAAIEGEIHTNKQTRKQLEDLCENLRAAREEAKAERMQVVSGLKVVEQNIDRLKKEEPIIAGEIDLLDEQIAQSVEKESTSKEKLEELETVNNERTARIKQLDAQRVQMREQQESLAGQLTELRVSLGQIAEQGKALRQTLMSLRAQMDENRAGFEATEEEIRDCEADIAQSTRDILACEAEVSELYLEKDRGQQDTRLLQTETEQLVSRRKQAEEQIRLKRAEKSQIEERINQLRIEVSQLEVKQSDLVERVQDELGIDLAEVYSSHEGREVDWDQIREEISELRGKIERLGNVNLDAIEEQETLEKRHEFLSTQVEDLNSSRGQLQQLINRLNKKSREQFKETFEQIRGHFQVIFRKLFGGGKADIVLEDSEDVLEAGIEIIARPPGKETRSISLLSGGEKSLTALALLFAVFKTKPSPFCFLDEVDAALDEANNERFNMLVQEFQKDSQFIIITHAKRTMSIADELVGITMQQRGVSKKISVRFGEYEPETVAVA